MTSTFISLPLPGTDYAISGLLRGKPRGGVVVVFVPPLMGDVDDLLPFLFSRRLEEAGYASLVYRNWGDADNEPNATDVDLHDCIARLSLVLTYVRRELGASRVVLIGHSMGGLVALRNGAEDVDAAVFWDASDPELLDEMTWVEELGVWRMQFGTEYLFGPALFQQWREVGRQEMASRWDKPLFVITAQNGLLQPAGRTYFETAPGARDYLELEGADHGFTAGESAFAVMDATLAWLQRTVPISATS